MDSSFITILLVVFLVVAGLAVDIGYMYVGEEELQHTAEMSALAGAEVLKHRILAQVQKEPTRLSEVINDSHQASVRAAAKQTAAGKHEAAALVGLANDHTNNLGSDNDLTVGFWDFEAGSYQPGGTPVNAVQVRARRTAESSTVGLGSIGTTLARLSGVESHNYTPVAIAALQPMARANLVMAADVCESDCVYPNVCAIPERKLVRGPWGKGRGPARDRFAFSALLSDVSATNPLSDLICGTMPSQGVCGKPVYVSLGQGSTWLRDLEAVMYNPELDKADKEYDVTSDTVSGWWVIVPLTESSPATTSDNFELHPVTKYALVRISRICAAGPPGCSQGGSKGFDAPTATCGPAAADAIYIDRISCVGCGSQAMRKFPGLQSTIVKTTTIDN